MFSDGNLFIFGITLPSSWNRMVFEKYDEKIIEQKTYQEYTEIYSKK